MSDELGRTEPSRTPAARRRRFRRRELELPDGSRLVLNGSGSIDQVAADGEVKQSWAREDPDWARHAIRFGLQPQESTIPPHGRYVRGSRPPRW